MMQIMQASNSTELSEGDWSSSYTEEDLAVAAESISNILDDFSIYLNLTDMPLAEFYKSSDGYSWTLLTEPLYEFLEHPNVVLAPNRTHGLASGTILFMNRTQGVLNERDLYYLDLPSFSDYEPSRYIDSNITIYVDEDMISPPLTLVPYDDIVADLATDTATMSSYLKGIANMDVDQVDAAMAMYDSLIASIPSGLVFIEPNPWPTTSSDFKGVLYSGSDALPESLGSLIHRDRELTFMPEESFVGSKQFRLWSINYDVAACRIVLLASWGTSQQALFRESVGSYDCLYDPILITYEVLDTNDAPIMSDSADLLLSNIGTAMATYFLPHTPYDLTGYDGFPVSDLIDGKFIDHDSNAELGVAILGAQNTAGIGEWQFKNSSGDWTTLELAQSYPSGLTKAISLDIYSFVRKCQQEPFSDACLDNIDFDSLLAKGLTGATYAHLLKPDVRIRYQPETNDTFWTWQEARTSVKLAWTAWDQTQFNSTQDAVQVELSNLFCLPDIYTDYAQYTCPLRGQAGSLCDVTVVGEMHREACNGEPSAEIAVDDCGMCGGSNECYDCLQVPFGSAVIDNCGACTEGSSGLAYDYQRDCAGVCNGVMQNVTIPIYGTSDVTYACISGTVEDYVSQFFCDAAWQSGAYINSCGYCVAGSTGVAVTEGMDACGVCGGSGDSCQDCAGVAFGPNDIDICGDCNNPASAAWNSGCLELDVIFDAVLWYAEPVTLTIPGAGLGNLQSLISIFANSSINPGIEFPLLNPAMDPNSTYIYGDLPDFSTSNAENADFEIFTLVATFLTTAGQTLVMVIPGHLTLYVPLDVAFITPEEITKGYTGEGVITGNTNDQLSRWDDLVVFIDCSYDEAEMIFIPACMSIAKYTKVGNQRIVYLPVLSVTDEQITVDLTIAGQVMKGMSLAIKANVEPPKYEREVTNAIVIPLVVMSDKPVATGSEFSGDLCSMSVSFDVNIGVSSSQTDACSYSTRSTCCEIVFSTASAAMLGTGSMCWIIGSKIQVTFGEGSTVNEGTTLSFAANTIKESGVDDTYALYCDSTVTVAALTTVPLPIVSMDSAPLEVSGCAVFQMKVSVGGSVGCLNPPELYWNIELADSTVVLGGSDQSLMTALQATLQDVTTTNIAIDGTQIPNGQTFNLTVFAINYMGFTSDVLLHQFVKIATESPIQVTLSGDAYVDPNDVVQLQTSVTETACSTIDISQISNQYSVNSIDFDMSSFLMNTVKLDGSVLNIRGGQTYMVTAKVTVLTTALEALTYESTHSFSVNMVDPVAVIQGPSKVGTTDEFTLDGSFSQDLNKDVSGLSYIWTCYNYTAADNGFDTVCRVWWDGSFVIMQNNLPNSDKATIPAGIVPIGSYQMCLEVVVGGLSDTDCMDIVVRPTSPPQVILAKTIENQSPLENLRIEGTICYAARATIEWVSVMEAGYSTLSLADDCTTESSTTKESWMNCKTVSLVCSGLDEGAVYKFDLTANEIDADDNIVVAEAEDGEEPDTYGSSQILVYTLSSPTISSFSVTPTSGDAFSTDFQFLVDASDPQDSVISYQYFLETLSGELLELSGKDAMSMHEQIIGPGEGYIKVIATNAYGLDGTAYSEMVTISEFDESSASTADISNIVQRGGLQAAMSLSSAVSDPALEAAIADIGQTSCQNELSSVSGADTTTSLQRVDTCTAALIALTTGDSRSADTSAAISGALATLGQTFGSGTTSSASRKKRSTSSVTAMSASEAESMLNLAALNFDGVADEDIVHSDAVDFFDMLENSVLVGLCQDRVVGETATEVFTDIGVVRIERHDFDPIASEVVNLACSDCTPASFNISATVVMGSYMENTYAQWACDTGVECQGACIASSQIPRDIVTASSSLAAPLMSTLRSDIVGLSMINPETAAFITPNLTDSGNTVQIALAVTGGSIDLDSYSLECRQWLSEDWTSSTCTSNAPVLAGSVYYVFCDCTEFTYTALFEGEPSVNNITSIDDSSDLSDFSVDLSVTICEPDTERVWVEFEFIADYETIVVDPPRFTAALLTHLAESLYIQEEQIIDLTLASEWIYSDIHPWFDQAAILVTFEIHDVSRLKRSTVTSLSVAEAVTYLEILVETDTLAFVPPVGIPLSTETTSFDWHVIVDPPTDYTPLIIAVVVVLLIATCIGVACCCWWFVMGRKRKTKTTDSQQIRNRIAEEVALESAACERYVTNREYTMHGATPTATKSRENTIVHVQCRENSDLGPIDGLVQTAAQAELTMIPEKLIEKPEKRIVVPTPSPPPIEKPKEPIVVRMPSPVPVHSPDLYTENVMEPVPFVAVPISEPVPVVADEADGNTDVEAPGRSVTVTIETPISEGLTDICQPPIPEEEEPVDPNEFNDNDDYEDEDDLDEAGKKRRWRWIRWRKLQWIKKTETTTKTEYTVPLPKVKKTVITKWRMPEPRKVPAPDPYMAPNSSAVLREMLKLPDDKQRTAMVAKKVPRKAKATEVAAKLAPVSSIYSRPVAPKVPGIANVVAAATAATKKPKGQAKQEKKLISILDNIRQKTVILRKSSVGVDDGEPASAGVGRPKPAWHSSSAALPPLSPLSEGSIVASTHLPLSDSRGPTPTTASGPITPRGDEDVALSVYSPAASCDPSAQEDMAVVQAD